MEDKAARTPRLECSQLVTVRATMGVSGLVHSFVHSRSVSSADNLSSTYLRKMLCEESCTHRTRSISHPGPPRRVEPYGSRTRAVPPSVRPEQCDLAAPRYESVAS